MRAESIFVQHIPSQADQQLNTNTSLYLLSLKQLQSLSLDNIRDQGLAFSSILALGKKSFISVD